MKRALLWKTLGASAIALVGMSQAKAATTCTHFGKFSAPRLVTGQVLHRERDRLGVSHIVVDDAETRCKVYVLVGTDVSCSRGQHFEGFGKLRTDFKGSDYDAVLDEGREKGRCS